VLSSNWGQYGVGAPLRPEGMGSPCPGVLWL